MRSTPSRPNRLINHVALVLDASGSMSHLSSQVIKVADAEIAHLAKRSKELNQETRVSVYTFDWEWRIECAIFDMDVLRLPSMKDLYRPEGMTALIDATLKSQDDLARTAQMYDDHAFLTYVLTDGAENRSRNTPSALAKHIAEMPENWTVAVLVPNQHGVVEAKRHGFPENNIAIWSATERGVEEAFSSIMRTATESFMVARSQGVRGSRSLFVGGNVDKAAVKEAVKASGLKHLPRSNYDLIRVPQAGPIRSFVETVTGKKYVAGSSYYELTKPETVQGGKKICVRNRKTGRLYVGDEARKLLGLPDHNVRVRPEDNKDFQIFVQSTSVNRKLVPDTKLLVMKP